MATVEIAEPVDGTCVANTVGVGVNRQGAFAEYLVLPAFNAFKLPDDISDDVASIF